MAVDRNAVSAPMCRIIANGNLEIGWGSGINVQEGTDLVPVDILGSLYSQQLCPVKISVSASVSAIHIEKESLEAAGLVAQGTTKDVITFQDILLELVNTLEDPKPIARVYGCRLAGRGLPLGRGGIIARDIRFGALRFEMVK